MPETRERERPVELREHFGRALEQRARLEVEDEEPGREHRTHRVRRRGADADLEDVEYREVHRAASRRRIRSAISPASAIAQRLLLVLLGEDGGLVVSVIAREFHRLTRKQLRSAARHGKLGGVIDLVLARLVVGRHGQQFATGVVEVNADNRARGGGIGRRLSARRAQAIVECGVERRISIRSFDVGRRERDGQRLLATQVESATRGECEQRQEEESPQHQTTTFTSFPGT